MLAFIRFVFAGLLLVISHAFAATVQDEHGTFTLEKTPQRIVVLELSFADALAAVDVSPIGIADDNDAKRILPEVRAHLKPWQSVGTRAQPSLEAIAALKPDLIIADSSRHAGVYIALQQIAPVLLLKSRNETYAENLQSAAIIGEMVGKKREMQARLEQHKERMAQWASQLPKGTRVAFGTSREQQFNLHTQETWTGSVLASLGLNVPAAMAGASMPSIGLEQLLAVNPAWLLVAHYREESIVKRWQQDPLWQMLTAAQKQQVASVDSNTWARMRGIFAAERIAADTVKIFHHQPLTVVKYRDKTPGAAVGASRCSTYYYFLAESVLLLGHSCFRSRCNPRPAAWTHANATRSAGAKPSFATKPGRRSDRRKPGARGHAAANPDPQPNGLSFTARH